ncbi:MAG TPA: hypothetical protein ENN81_00240 [Phycisphaerales bacterium]|nr:hypothetical protein [Phycisphaerales bacterium]
MKRRGVMVAVVGLLVAVWASGFQVEPISVPNGSFESPQTLFVSPVIDSWQKSPKPWWYDESGGYLWIQLTGVFLNLPPEDPETIDNCDGQQAAWLFAVPEVGLFQDLEATYEMGRFYRLTVGVIGGGANMKDNVPIAIRLYYRDEQDNKVAVGATTCVYRTEMGYVKHLNDVILEIGRVQETDVWAGKNIGVEIVSELVFPMDLDPETGRAGGFWDLDHVRLEKSAVGPDFTADGIVNFEDLAMMAQEWMACEAATVDLTGEGCVDMDDMAILAGFWLQQAYVQPPTDSLTVVEEIQANFSE